MAERLGERLEATVTLPHLPDIPVLQYELRKEEWRAYARTLPLDPRESRRQQLLPQEISLHTGGFLEYLARVIQQPEMTVPDVVPLLRI